MKYTSRGVIGNPARYAANITLQNKESSKFPGQPATGPFFPQLPQLVVAINNYMYCRALCESPHFCFQVFLLSAVVCKIF